MNLIEIIALTADDAKRIEGCGGDRIELISEYGLGGLTPCRDTIEKVVRAVKIPVNVMIRPHSKHFAYSQEEIALMKSDIAAARDLGAHGVVFGALNKRGIICLKRTGQLISRSFGLDITFHRAVDELPNPLEGIRAFSKFAAITSVLTSGGSGNVAQNTAVINEMIQHSRHINILIGGGLNFDNIALIREKTGATQFHFGRAVRNDITFEIDEQKLKRMVRLCKEV